MADVNRGNRPLSPHLSIYRPQLTSMSSIDMPGTSNATVDAKSSDKTRKAGADKDKDKDGIIDADESYNDDRPSMMRLTSSS